MEFNTNAYGESRRRKVSSVIPPDVDANSMRCCRNISNTDAAVSTKGLSICRHSKRRIHLSGKDSMQLKENKSSQKSSEQMHSSPFGKYDIQKSKHQSSSWRPVRKTQRSMSAHSAATPGPDSAVLRDPLTGKIYKRGKLLGKGGFAKVYEGVEVSTGKRYALKIIDKTRISMPPQREKVDAEIDLHAAASEAEHPYVARFEGTFEDSRIICLVLELCSKRSLAQYLRRKEFLREAEVSDIMWQIICGLNHIHGCGLIHRDLKLGNILLSEDSTVKIADFGLATRTSWGKRRTICGTPNFIAPEVLNRQGYGPEADLWAIGCILFTLLVGKPPFDSGSMKDTYKCILKNRYQIPNFVSSEASDLVQKLLQSKPQARPTLNEVLRHSFFVKNETATRLPSLEELTQEHPHREIVSAPVIPLRRRSGLPQMKMQCLISGSGYSEGSQLRHGTCLSDPCLVTSTAKFNQDSHQSSVPTKTGASTVESAIGSGLHSEYVNSSSVDRATHEHTEGSNSLSDHQQTHMEENNNNCTKEKISQHPPQKQHKMSPIKKIASKLQKIKIPSPKKSVKTTAQKVPTAPEPVQAPVVTVKNTNEPIWVTKWVDYSNKYGFGYQLATGELGIFFNDGAHIMLLNDGSTVELLAADWKSAEDTKVFSISSPPSGCLRTVNILRLFINYMDQHLEAHGSASSTTPPLQSTVKMLTWSRTAKHVVMYLSNGTLQVNFCDDHSKVNIANVHNKSSMIVSYVNKNKESIVYTGSEIMNIRNSELRQRLRQVHEEFHYLFGESECVSHPFCNVFQDTSDLDTISEYQDTRLDMIAAR